MTLKLPGHVGTIEGTVLRETRCPHGNPHHKSHIDGSGTTCCVDLSAPQEPEKPWEPEHEPGHPGEFLGEAAPRQVTGGDLDPDLQKAMQEYLGDNEPK